MYMKASAFGKHLGKVLKMLSRTSTPLPLPIPLPLPHPSPPSLLHPPPPPPPPPSLPHLHRSVWTGIHVHIELLYISVLDSIII